MSDDEKPMTDEERRAFLEKWQQDNLASMTPFKRYLYDIGLFDDVIRPEITAENVILEPVDLCIDVGCEECIGYWKSDGQVTYCTHECDTNFKATEVPYNHCSYKGRANCPEVVPSVRSGVTLHLRTPSARAVNLYLSMIVSPEMARPVVEKLRAGETVEFPNRYELGEVMRRFGGSWKD